MLRASLLRSRYASAGVKAPRAGAQWLPAHRLTAPAVNQRLYADDKKPSETVVPVAVGTSTAAVSPPASKTLPPPPPPPKKKRRFRRFLLYLLTLSVLGYGGGVYYSLISDNFHDFFTEFVPFGEEAVGYLEEREFRKRFQSSGPLSQLRSRDDDKKVTIPKQSGASWRVSENDGRKPSDLGSRNGRHISAVDDNKLKPEQPKKTAQSSEKPTDSHTHTLLPKDNSLPKAEPKSDLSPKSEAQPAVTSHIDNLSIDAAQEPVVQDVVKILNDLITVINADQAAGKYSSSINKAKEDLSKVIKDISVVRDAERKVAEEKIRSMNIEFDNAAKELIRRFDEQMQDQESRWKDEYETEREKLSEAYQSKLHNEISAAQKVYDQRLKNELLEHQIAISRDFAATIRERVEKERSGRLAKLNELSEGVQELERLTSEWNSVVDANLKTQHLVVAVEAVRATLENADRPKPFTEELLALKEVASDDPVINAAIASINPSAYQRGIPTTSQLIDRFRRVAAEVRKASLLPENAGVASHIASLALSKVMFKKQGLPVGDDVESVLARTEQLLEEGNLDEATREMNMLNGWAKMLARDWLGECRKVLEVRQALDVVATEARLQSLLVE